MSPVDLPRIGPARQIVQGDAEELRRLHKGEKAGGVPILLQALVIPPGDGQVLCRLHLGQTALLPQAPQPFIEYHLYPPPLMDIVSLPPAASFLPAGARTLCAGGGGLFGVPEGGGPPPLPFLGAGGPPSLLIGLDDPLDQHVADHVALRQAADGDVLHPLSTRIASRRPETLSAGRSIWVMSPVMTILEPKPRRVRNIFICSREVFWASSRMMKESSRVRPRI